MRAQAATSVSTPTTVHTRRSVFFFFFGFFGVFCAGAAGFFVSGSAETISCTRTSGAPRSPPLCSPEPLLPNSFISFSPLWVLFFL